MSAATRRQRFCTCTSPSLAPARTRPNGTPESLLTWRPAGRALTISRGSSWRSLVVSGPGSQAGPVPGHEVLAFDLYGTLVDPIAIAGELGHLLGDTAGREAAGLWRL